MKQLKLIDHKESYAINALLFVIGLLFIFEKWIGWKFMYTIVLIYSFIKPTMMIVHLARKEKIKEPFDYFMIVFDYGFGAILAMNPSRFVDFTHIFFGWWMLARGIIMCITYYIEKKDEASRNTRVLIGGLFSIGLGLFMIFSRKTSIKTEVFSLLTGIYFVLYAFFDSLSMLNETRNIRGKTSFSISAPVILNAFLPLRAYISIKQLLHDSKEDLTPDHQEDVDIMVYVYIKGKGPESLGHLDLSYKGKIYSYGNHDPKNRRFFEILGDGVLIEADEQAFLQQSVEKEHKLVVGYGIKLTDEEKRLFEERLSNLQKRSYPWYCDAAIHDERNMDLSNDIDYASRVYKDTKCKMYKFTSGQFKTYFVFFTNCVLLADYLVRNKSLNLINVSGVVTPGAYLSFLNRAYLKDDTPVISRIVYDNHQ